MICSAQQWEHPQHDHTLNHVCNQTNEWARRHGRCDVESRKHKSTCGGTSVSLQPLLCVFLSFSVVSLIWGYLSLTSTQIKLHNGYKCNQSSTWARADCITVCVLSASEKSMQSQLLRELTARLWVILHCVCMLSEVFSS